MDRFAEEAGEAAGAIGAAAEARAAPSAAFNETTARGALPAPGKTLPADAAVAAAELFVAVPDSDATVCAAAAAGGDARCTGVKGLALAASELSAAARGSLGGGGALADAAGAATKGAAATFSLGTAAALSSARCFSFAPASGPIHWTALKTLLLMNSMSRADRAMRLRARERERSQKK